MLETVFTVFIAGCAHGATPCVPLERFEVRAASMTACEGLLDTYLSRQIAEYPEYLGQCVEKPGAIAGAPLWWPEEGNSDAPATVAADKRQGVI